jgi:hypothetical protein
MIPHRMPLPFAFLDFTVRLAAAIISLPVVLFLYLLQERARGRGR